MKKIAAFITALAVFLAIIITFHTQFDTDLQMNNRDFGTWYNPYKDLSCQALRDNTHIDTMYVFGSSEFRHEVHSKVHPKNLFKGSNAALMTVGGPYNQCLNHAITLGAVENKIKNRKAVLMLSPSWFYKEGVTPKNYVLRFSESSYMQFMADPAISDSIKKYVAKRNEDLLHANLDKLNAVKRINRIFLYKNASSIDRSMFKIRSQYVLDRDALSLKGILLTSGIKKNDSYPAPGSRKSFDWRKLEHDSTLSIENNYDRNWNMTLRNQKKFSKRYKSAEGLHANEDFSSSPEYGDLKCFLDICRERGIKVKMIVLPLNGKWFDHTGITKDKRQVFSEKIKQICAEYSADLTDLSKYDYENYITSDAVHLIAKGWVKVDEEIYRFYNQD